MQKRKGTSTVSEAARLMQSKRKIHRGGRPPLMRRCGGCGIELSSRELRAHIARCPGKAQKAK